ncbi:carotenoid oxygenase family protein, partial [Stenotrophomonas maltophilia]|uniref:carotenoid oxygenase family protein n=1 Tax=Stenotrophomonas maltophilia TaxID=40324 RepID=UPI00195312F9
NPQFDVPGAHWFVGDGMLHAFHLENGRASYRNRWVRTAKWQAEHDAGRAHQAGKGCENLGGNAHQLRSATSFIIAARNSGMPVVFWLDQYRPH